MSIVTRSPVKVSNIIIIVIDYFNTLIEINYKSITTTTEILSITYYENGVNIYSAEKLEYI